MVAISFDSNTNDADTVVRLIRLKEWLKCMFP